MWIFPIYESAINRYDPEIVAQSYEEDYWIYHPNTMIPEEINPKQPVAQMLQLIHSFIHSVFMYSRNINLKFTKMKKQQTVVKRIKSELHNYNNNSNINNDNNNALRNKGLTLKYENILSWFDNDFDLTVIETAYVTFAFGSKPCCNIFLEFNIRIFCFYVLW